MTCGNADRNVKSATLASRGADSYGPPAFAGARLGRERRRIKSGGLHFRRRSSLPSSGRKRTDSMADRVVPHFHNTPGVAVIEIGAHEFMCEGEVAPFDHPHVYLDMGDATEIICPYCSTLFRLDSTLDPHAARPAECALADGRLVR